MQAAVQAQQRTEGLATHQARLTTKAGSGCQGHCGFLPPARSQQHPNPTLLGSNAIPSCMRQERGTMHGHGWAWQCYSSTHGMLIDTDMAVLPLHARTQHNILCTHHSQSLTLHCMQELPAAAMAGVLAAHTVLKCSQQPTGQKVCNSLSQPRQHSRRQTSKALIRLHTISNKLPEPPKQAPVEACPQPAAHKPGAATGVPCLPAHHAIVELRQEAISTQHPCTHWVVPCLPFPFSTSSTACVRGT